MPVLHAKKRKAKHTKKDRLFWNIGSLMGDVYKYMTSKNGLLHDLTVEDHNMNMKKKKRRKKR